MQTAFWAPLTHSSNSCLSVIISLMTADFHLCATVQVLQEQPPTPRQEEEQFAPLPPLDLGSLDALQQELDAKVVASYAPVPKPYRPWEDLTPSHTGQYML